MISRYLETNLALTSSNSRIKKNLNTEYLQTLHAQFCRKKANLNGTFLRVENALLRAPPK